jgi:hypothetical protein
MSIGRFLESPVDSDGDPNPTDNRLILDRIKGAVSRKLPHFCVLQLCETAQPDWQIGYAFRGTGSIFHGRQKNESLYGRWVPEPTNEADDMHHIHELADSVKRLVASTIDETRKVTNAEASSNVDIAAQ